jgi:hypothetical protein
MGDFSVESQLDFVISAEIQFYWRNSQFYWRFSNFIGEVHDFISELEKTGVFFQFKVPALIKMPGHQIFNTASDLLHHSGSASNHPGF